jgi:hypothetical protein
MNTAGYGNEPPVLNGQPNNMKLIKLICVAFPLKFAKLGL